MECPDCGAPVVRFSVPEHLREHVPGGEPAAAICTRCLALRPADGADPDPDFGAVSDAFPAGEAAAPLALLVGLLDSLALHRAAIEALLARVERAGVDPLLAIDRLAADPGLDPAVDLDGRRRQLERLL